MSTSAILTTGVLLLIFCCTDCKDVSSDESSNGTAYSEPINLQSLRPAEARNCSDYVQENEYILLENGSLLLPSSDMFGHDQYIIENDTVYICVQEAQPARVAAKSLTYDFSHEFLVCGHILVDPDEYELLQNGSIYINIYRRIIGPRDYYITDQGVYVCVPQYEEMMVNASREDYLRWRLNKFSESFTYVTYTGLILSIISLLSHLAVFCAVASLRNLPGCCLASLSLSLLMAYVCFIAIDVVPSADVCTALGLSVYYFFLTSFFWMNAIAFDIWRSFRSVMRELRISSHRIPWRRFLLYSLYSWAVPAALAVTVKLADATDIIPDEFRPNFGDPVCWFGNRKSLLVFFAVPLGVVLLLNAAFFLDVTCVISRATLRTSQPHEATLKKRFFMFMRLALIMGLTWIVGLVAAYADNMVLWYMFIVLNTLQGLFIFVVFSCSSKVRSLCFKRFSKNSKTSGNTSVRTISHTSAGV